MCHRINNKNQFKKIQIDNQFVKVDQCMVKLIKDLNKNGIKTYSCCCGHYRKNIPHIGYFSTNKNIWNITKFIRKHKPHWNKYYNVIITFDKKANKHAVYMYQNLPTSLQKTFVK